MVKVYPKLPEKDNPTDGVMRQTLITILFFITIYVTIITSIIFYKNQVHCRRGIKITETGIPIYVQAHTDGDYQDLIIH